MKTLTIRGIDMEMDEKIKEKAQESRESINKMMLRLLKSALGIGEKKPTFPIYHDLDHLAGTWTKEDEEEFNANTKAFEKIDEELWK